MSLNEQIIAYLNANKIAFAPGDYRTEQPQGSTEVITFWDTAKLGAVPSSDTLAAATFTPVPVSVTPGQAKVALLRTANPSGTGTLFDAVDSYINGLTDTTARETQVWWTSATIFERNNPHITAVATVFSLTDAQVDDLFRLAATVV